MMKLRIEHKTANYDHPLTMYERYDSARIMGRKFIMAASSKRIDVTDVCEASGDIAVHQNTRCFVKLRRYHRTSEYSMLSESAQISSHIGIPEASRNIVDITVHRNTQCQKYRYGNDWIKSMFSNALIYCPALLLTCS